MITNPLYLEDSYLREVNATIVDVKEEGENKYRLILDQTVFYPMGGGQPTDQGTISTKNWEAEVYQVMMKDGEIWHYVKCSSTPQIKEVVHGVINWDRRYKNMRMHTAGHIIDFAMYLLGHSPSPLSPLKADHGKKPFIVYGGTLKNDFRQELEEKTNELVEKDLKFSWNFQPLEDLQKEAIYLQPNLPTNKPLRTFRLETVGAVADGGTQLRTTREAGKIIISGIQTENNQTIISYDLAS